MTILKEKSLEKFSNIAVIIVAIVVVFSFLKHDFGSSTNPDTSFKASAVHLTSITPTPSKLNVVLGISTTCHFCEQNMGFYKTLSNLQTPDKIALYTIFPQSKDEASSFLLQKDIHPAAVISSPLSKYDISGTPTLLLVNASGKVERAWVGSLDSGKQAEVLQQIRQNS
jgi:thioredoxin-related protein